MRPGVERGLGLLLSGLGAQARTVNIERRRSRSGIGYEEI
jgi:hypothetical protein